MASRFVINNELTFTGEELVSGSVLLEKATDLAGEELSADVLHFSVFYDDSDSTLRNEKYAVPIVYYEDDLAIGTFYLTNVERIASRMYKIEAASMVGILSKQMHYGGMYTAVGAKKLMTARATPRAAGITRKLLTVSGALNTPFSVISTSSTSNIP